MGRRGHQAGRRLTDRRQGCCQAGWLGGYLWQVGSTAAPAPPLFVPGGSCPPLQVRQVLLVHLPSCGGHPGAAGEPARLGSSLDGRCPATWPGPHHPPQRRRRKERKPPPTSPLPCTPRRRSPWRGSTSKSRLPASFASLPSTWSVATWGGAWRGWAASARLLCCVRLCNPHGQWHCMVQSPHGSNASRPGQCRGQPPPG